MFPCMCTAINTSFSFMEGFFVIQKIYTSGHDANVHSTLA